MSTFKKERNKDISNFHHLCKDLFKYIKRRIIKRYVQPETSFKSKTSPIEEDSVWKYYNTKENITEEEKIYDIFKDNIFLSQVQKCYLSLEVVISSLDENKKNFEFLKKDIEVGEKKIKLLSELNSQLNQYFNSSNESNLNCWNDKNVISHLSLVKSFNILNDLKIINSIKDLNTQENITNHNMPSNTNISNNNIIIDSKIQEKEEIEESLTDNTSTNNIENNKKEKDKNSVNYNKNEYQNIPKKNDLKFLNKKVKRERYKKERYIDIYDNKSLVSSFSSNNSNNKGQNQKNKNENKSDKNKNQKEEYNKNEESSLNTLIDKINVSQTKSLSEENDNNRINENNDKNDKTNDSYNKETNFINNYKDNSEIEFEKVLKSEFSCIYSNPKRVESNNDIIQEIKKILKKIPSIKFPDNKNKFQNPSLIGTHKNIETIYLLDSIPAIDILFKCMDIKNIEEINEISEETMVKKLCLSYIEICKGYDKESEIVKVTNKCKIKMKDNYFFIYINLFFVNVNISSYVKKEKCINRYMFSNEIYNNKDKILMCLFFRRWRRKFKLFFMVPEFLDIIINFYYSKSERISLIIENIFYDLFNGEINFYSKKDKIIDDEKNINEIVGYIGEWYNIPDHKTALNSAIIVTNEFLLKNDYLSVVKSD